MDHIIEGVLKYHIPTQCYMVPKDFNGEDDPQIFTTRAAAEHYILDIYIDDWRDYLINIQDAFENTFHETYKPLNDLNGLIKDYYAHYLQPINQAKKAHDIYQQVMELRPWLKEFGQRCDGVAYGRLREGGGKPHRVVIRFFELEDPFNYDDDYDEQYLMGEIIELPLQ